MILIEENAKVSELSGVAQDTIGFYEKCGYKLIMETYEQKFFKSNCNYYSCAVA